MSDIRSVAFIPARSGSKRILDKNIKYLNGHPLLAYSIRAAIDSGVFDAVICATDSQYYAEIAKYYGAEVPFLRSDSISGDKSPDIEWVDWMLTELKAQGREYDIFSILRPTSPFRKAATIQRAWKTFNDNREADSLRAIEKCSQHPGKMWVVRDQRLLPILPFTNDATPWHSSQYSALPEIYVQNASLEIAWTRLVFENYSIAGSSIISFITTDIEGFDINRNEDWIMAEYYLNSSYYILPKINISPFKN